MCRETTEGLGRMIARELQPPVLADQLDLSEVSTQLRPAQAGVPGRTKVHFSCMQQLLLLFARRLHCRQYVTDTDTLRVLSL